MGIFSIFSCFARWRRRPRLQPEGKIILETRIQAPSVPDRTSEPYLPMSPDHKYRIYLQADGDHGRVLVNAYLDPDLDRSIISETKAGEVKAELKKLPQPVQLKDDQGRQYMCQYTTRIDWYLLDAQSVTQEEKFYVFGASDVDVAVRLRKNIEPLGQRSAGEQRVNNIDVLHNAEDTQSGRKDQDEHEREEHKRQEEARKAREKKIQEKYAPKGPNGGNSGQGTDSASRRRA